MSDCRASKRARKNSCRYQLRQLTIEISEEDNRELKNNLDKYLNQKYAVR